MTEHRRPIKLLSKANLRDAWDRSRRANKAGAPGIDRVSATTFAENLDSNLSRIAKQLQNGEYGFSDLRPVFIAKASGTKERMICIPTVQDRLVQRAMCWYLDQKQKFPIYNESSFGFVTGRGGTHNAILASLKLREKFDWCLKTDIESFFDCIPRNYLLNRIKQELGSEHSFLPLLTKVVNCEVKQGLQAEKIRKQKIKLGTGIRQGMPLSPILANLVLSNFDEEIKRRGINMVRYADDLLFFFAQEKTRRLEISL
jgi:RNA-directed DNA polymerase